MSIQPTPGDPAAPAETVVDPRVLAARRARRTEGVDVEAQLAQLRAQIAEALGRIDADEARWQHRIAELEAQIARHVELEEDVEQALHGLREQLAVAYEELAARHAREAHLEGLIADLVATAEDLRGGFAREIDALRDELDRERERSVGLEYDLATARATALLQAAVPALARDHPALAELTVAAPSAPPPETMIGDIDRAALRLRAAAGEEEAEVDELPRVSLPIRIDLRSRPAAPGPWIAKTIGTLADSDETLAARLLLALLPVQARRVNRELCYVLLTPGHRSRLVQCTPDGAVTTELLEPGARADEAQFQLSAPIAALAPLVAGGASRRPQGVELTGRRKHLRRLSRAMSDCAGLATLHRAGVVLPDRDLLALIAAAIDPLSTEGQTATIAFDTGQPEHQALVLADGAPVGVTQVAPGAADATLHPWPSSLLQVLAGEVPATVSGDADAARALLAHVDAVQSAR